MGHIWPETDRPSKRYKWCIVWGLRWVATMPRIVTSIPALVPPVLAHPDADAACTARCNLVWMQMRTKLLQCGCRCVAAGRQMRGRLSAAPPTHLLLSPIGRAPVTAKREECPSLSLRLSDQGMGLILLILGALGLLGPGYRSGAGQTASSTLFPLKS